MQRSIHIPQPCSESWEMMTPAAQGRHCAQCCKTVIDFTGWEVAEIAEYLTRNAESRVCGRFTEDQLQQNYFIPATYLHNVFTSGLHYAKQIAAIIVFVFILSDTAAAQSKQPREGRQTQQPLTGEVAAQPPPQHLAGAPVAIPQQHAKDTTKPAIKDRAEQKRPPMVMGKIRIVPPKKRK